MEIFDDEFKYKIDGMLVTKEEFKKWAESQIEEKVDDLIPLTGDEAVAEAVGPIPVGKGDEVLVVKEPEVEQILTVDSKTLKELKGWIEAQNRINLMLGRKALEQEKAINELIDTNKTIVKLLETLTAVPDTRGRKRHVASKEKK